jgi:hypothetical protein
LDISGLRRKFPGCPLDISGLRMKVPGCSLDISGLRRKVQDVLRIFLVSGGKFQDVLWIFLVSGEKFQRTQGLAWKYQESFLAVLTPPPPPPITYSALPPPPPADILNSPSFAPQTFYTLSRTHTHSPSSGRCTTSPPSADPPSRRLSTLLPSADTPHHPPLPRTFGHSGQPRRRRDGRHYLTVWISGLSKASAYYFLWKRCEVWLRTTLFWRLMRKESHFFPGVKRWLRRSVRE